MAMFNSYVKLPEGMSKYTNSELVTESWSSDDTRKRPAALHLSFLVTTVSPISI